MTKVVYNDCYGGFGLSNEAIDWLLERGSKYIRLHEDSRFKRKGVWDEGPRHDPLLVECVETLGKEASDQFAKLAIVEIQGPLYRVDEYDGMEYIQEPDDIDWVDVRKEWQVDDDEDDNP